MAVKIAIKFGGRHLPLMGFKKKNNWQISIYIYI